MCCNNNGHWNNCCRCGCGCGCGDNEASTLPAFPNLPFFPSNTAARYPVYVSYPAFLMELPEEEENCGCGCGR